MFIFRNIEEILAEKGEIVQKLSFKTSVKNQTTEATLSTNIEIISEDNSIEK